MGVSDPSFLGLISGKVRSWIADLSWVSCGDYSMEGGEMGDMSVCHDCRLGLVMSGYGGAHCCQSCARLFCSQCMGSLRRGNCLKFPEEESVFQMELCRFCFQAVGGDVQIGYGFDKKWDEPSSPEKSPDVEGNNLPDAPQVGLHRLRCSTDSIYEDDDDDDYGKNFLSPCSMFSHDVSDLDSSSFSNGVDFYSFRSSPLDSPSRLDQQIVSSATPSQKPCVSNQEATAYVTTPRSETEESIDQSGHYAGNNGSSFKRIRENLERDDDIWIPPPPKDVADDMEIGLFRCDDEDDDVAGTCHVMKSYCFDDCTSVLKEDDQKEALRDSVYDHFRALVSQMLRDEGICEEDMDDGSNWLGIVSLLAWQAANFVKPDTSREGSMDPSDYVKVKCIPSGIPSESFLIKGIVCTRNVRHKRMNTHHKNPRILIMGGELEFQKSHKLASMNALITDQKSDNLDMAFSKIEAHKPNILLVEKSVSPDAAQCMLSKGISLVTNVKRNLLQRIAKCTNARITESIDDVPSTRLGSCESFYVNRVSEECLTGNSVNRKPSKTLMFFDGCPRRLGCTVLLKGTNLEELKRVKRVVQFATFAAYHLSLETSFLADEGATLHKTQFSNTFQGGELPIVGTDLNSLHLAESVATSVLGTVDSSVSDCLEIDGLEKHGSSFYTSSDIGGLIGKNAPMYPSNSSCHPVKEDSQFSKIHPMESPDKGARNSFGNGLRETFSIFSSADRFTETNQTSVNVAGNQTSNEFSSTSEKNQNILVSLTRSCKGMICGRSQLLRIKFYGNFDKPLGRYLHENLFDQASSCESCREPMDSHVFCYTHQHGNLTINAKRLSNVRLSGERDGRIWMWHRCLKCASKDGIPPAAKRVIMSDAAWGLSFGKFLELSFSSHATANRLASCGHSLQKDCLRFYGCGNKVAFFRYAPVDILSVHLPPPVLDFSSQLQQKWLQQMSMNVSSKMEILHEEVLKLLLGMEQKICSSEFESIKPSLLSRISFFKDLLERERSSYNILLRPVAGEINEANRRHDILVLNCSRRSLLIDSYTWDRRFSQLDSMLKAKNSVSSDSSFDAKTLNNKSSSFSQDRKYDVSRKIERNSVGDYHVDTSALENGFPLSMATSTENISDKIDSAWTGCGDSEKMETPKKSNVYLHGSDPPKISLPQRFYSFNAILRTQERSLKLSSESRQLSSFNTLSYDDSQNFQKVSPSKSSGDKQNVQLPFGSSPSFISSQSCMETDGARLLLPLADDSDVFVAVYDDEPSSIIAYALSSKEYTEFVMHASEILGWNISSQTADNMSIHQNSASNHPALQSLSNDKVPSKFVTPEELMLSHSSFVSDPKQPHFRFSFDDESSFPSNKAKFSVTCYFARQFSALGKMCYPIEMDFVRSLSRCKKWSAEGGKSNAYFAKSLDDRFIIKQVTKTEMEAFEEFAPQYFSYLRESIDTGSPTCLAKILGIFQVTVKHLKGGREVKMDLMVMENLFYGREISRIYDLKGSSRSRYIADATGDKKVLLDSNLLEILQTKPIFLGSKAKRRLERAIWNDTAFLASIDVMDYSLLVGIDDERKQLVIGIIDFMRQYTWDKHLETWVKASGILGGPKNAAPTIVSPIQYKKRFRKAMSSYFLTVPDQWPS